MWHDVKKSRLCWFLALSIVLAATIYVFIDARKTDVQGKVVVCIPVYGQSLALGEEAERVTDLSLLGRQHQGRIVTENIDDKFGYFNYSPFKQYIIRLLHHRKRSFELSVYGMAEQLVSALGADTVVCIFPGGQGATALAQLSKGTRPYQRFLSDVAKACRQAGEGGARRFYVPAICWMQGESDIDTYPDTDYAQLLRQFATDINSDVKAITHQREDVRIISYQTNAVTKGSRFQANNYDCPEVSVPQAQATLLAHDTLFWASGPTYPYTFMREYIHIDGVSQKRMGHLQARAALSILRHEPRFTGLQPTSLQWHDSTVVVRFHVPTPPLVLDTVLVSKAPHYGFSVISSDNTDVVKTVTLADSTVTLQCSSPVAGCRVRYAVNGEPLTSGHQRGPRGNLRDSEGDRTVVNILGQDYPQHHWCLQFCLDADSLAK